MNDPRDVLSVGAGPVGATAALLLASCDRRCTTLAGPELGRVALADLPDTQMDAIESVSPTRNAHLPQNVLEPLLWHELRDSDPIDLWDGIQYRSHTELADGVEVSITDPTTGACATVAPLWFHDPNGPAVGPGQRARRAMK